MRPTISALLNTAQSHFNAGRLDEAAAALKSIIETNPAHGEALEGLAYIAANQHDHMLAVHYFDTALDNLPPLAGRFHDAALSHQAVGNHARATQLFEQALKLLPGNIESMHGAALSLTVLNENERALSLFERAGRLDAKSWQIQYNMGRALGLLGRLDEEVAAYRRAIQLNPNCVPAYVNLGVALRDLHRFDDAIKMFKKAIQIDPDSASARTNRAQLNLLLGEFEHGWREYEWRWRDGGQQHEFGDRMWTGDASLAGKTLLVHAEQGFGDTIQFVRYIGLLEGRGARVVLRVQDSLLSLLGGLQGVDELIGESHDVPVFDYHCPLLSLPHVLKTGAVIPPAAIPYRQGDTTPFPFPTESLRVGIAWSGSTWHVNDRSRSVPLAELSDLFELDASFVSLQKEVRETDRAAFSAVGLLDLSDQLKSFADTAVLIDSLDLVITVDTAVAHLAGALGKPVWLMLPYTPDWRWQMNRSDTPWYPTMTLFRQHARGDWSAVRAKVSNALAEFIDNRKRRNGAA